MRPQREKLGDRRCDVTILIDCENIIRVFPNISNQLRYQKNRGGGQSKTSNNMLVNPFGPPTMAPNRLMNSQHMNSQHINSQHMNNQHMNNQHMNILVDRNIVDKGAEDIYELLK